MVSTDVTDREEVAHMVEATVKEWERIDVLLNVAGGAGDIWVKPAIDMEEEYYDELHHRNLKSVFLCNQAVARVMVEHRAFHYRGPPNSRTTLDRPSSWRRMPQLSSPEASSLRTGDLSRPQ